MGIITAKVRKGKMQRLTFTGNITELCKVEGIVQEHITGNQLTFPPDYVLVTEILNLGGVSMTPDVQSWYNDQLDFDAAVSLSLREQDEIELNLPLRDYQRSGIKFGKTTMRFILGDECGLGKTIQSLGIVAEQKEILVIAPAYGLESWADEYQNVNKGHKVYSVTGVGIKKHQIIEDIIEDNGKKIVIVSSGSIIKPNCFPLISHHWDAIIVDEAHRISNRKNILTRVIQALSKNTQLLIFLTGCSLKTRYPDTLWSMLNCIDPIRFSSYWAFYHKFVESYADYYGRVPVSSKNMNVLAQILAPLYLRREKLQVASELPPKIERVIKVTLKPEHKAIYNRVVSDRLADDVVIAQGIHLFGYLQRLVNYPEGLGYEHYDAKTETVMELVHDILCNGEKVVIFGWHKDYLRQLHAALAKITIDTASEGKRISTYQSVYVEGELSPVLRGEVIKRFQQEENIGVLIGTISSMGELVNIPEASNVILVEGFWNPQVMNNAIDRCHRLTSKSPVNVYWILAKDTIDEGIYKICAEKEEFIDETHALLRLIQEEKSRGKELIQ